MWEKTKGKERGGAPTVGIFRSFFLSPIHRQDCSFVPTLGASGPADRAKVSTVGPGTAIVARAAAAQARNRASGWCGMCVF